MNAIEYRGEKVAEGSLKGPTSARSRTRGQVLGAVARYLRKTLLVLVLLFLAAWLPRVLGLDVFVTPDERKWLTRSANFYQAITHGDFASTMQTEHPGVTVMWAGTLAFLRELPSYAQGAPRQLIADDLEAWLQQNSQLTPLQLLTTARWWVTLAIVLAITTCFFPLCRLFGARAAVVAVLFLAWDPFFLGLSRQLHLDGLLSSLLCLALLAFLAWLYAGQQWRALVLAGVVHGLAVLTKTPAILLVPFAGLLVLVEWLRRRRAGQGKQLALLLGFVLWLALSRGTFGALWPAMWLDPPAVLTQIVNEMLLYAGGHSLPNYFLGQITNDPGLLFYPLAYLLRTTPLTLAGLLAAAVWLWRRQPPLAEAAARRTVLALIGFALVFAAGMTIGAKKFDRYLLPAMVALDIVAALGWMGVANQLVQWWKRQRMPTTPTGPWPLSGPTVGGAVLAVALLFQGLSGLVVYPYYLLYFNPLAGGSRVAPKVLLTGWGEGLNEAAAWLNQQPNADDLQVVSWYGDGPLSWFLQSRNRPLAYEFPDFWLVADYAVLYANQWQRRLPSPETIDYLSSHEPAYVVKAHGLELARVYDMRRVPPPELAASTAAPLASFGGQIGLSAFAFDDDLVLAGDHIPVTLFLTGLDEMAVDYQLHMSLIAGNGTALWQQEGWPAQAATSSWQPEEVWRDHRDIAIPADAIPGRYRLALSILDPVSRAPLAVAGGTVDLAEAGDSFTIAWVEVQTPVRTDLDARWEQVRLSAISHQPFIQPGQTLLVEVVAEECDCTLKISARVLDASGKMIAQNDKVLRPEMRFELSLPDDVEPGPYTLAAVIYDPETLAPFPDQQGAFITTLSPLMVRPIAE